MQMNRFTLTTCKVVRVVKVHLLANMQIRRIPMKLKFFIFIKKNKSKIHFFLLCSSGQLAASADERIGAEEKRRTSGSAAAAVECAAR